jgi:hypothetical protein
MSKQVKRLKEKKFSGDKGERKGRGERIPLLQVEKSSLLL